MVKVQLIEHTPNPDAVVYYATRLTYTSDDPLEMWKEIISNKDNPKYQKKMKKLINTVVRRGHYSVLEHVNFTFIIDGCSRVCTHQLVRHRIASYSQRSHRYTKIQGTKNMQIPPSIKNDPELYDLVKKYMNTTIKFYKALINNGIPQEDARFFIPQAVTSPIMVTMNARELLHFFGLRLCTHAQWEIRQAAALMLNEVKKVAPIIFENAGPRCYILGYCPEEDAKCPVYQKLFGVNDDISYKRENKK